MGNEESRAYLRKLINNPELVAKKYQEDIDGAINNRHIVTLGLFDWYVKDNLRNCEDYIKCCDYCERCPCPREYEYKPFLEGCRSPLGIGYKMQYKFNEDIKEFVFSATRCEHRKIFELQKKLEKQREGNY